ncbi:glycosyl hydrolase family 61-domain-containing protein [Microdochium bolleyi]|uniref:lytic cellulose monooxygenase (C4-dehydrogenating) n=1 Tax=Microdochium bolleyi TaxID=196109 RepID=A0A136JBD4_9PEZI|nr:glycosyl hydrolase family 61-domain-containing protein [Microdochium bolleyi]
MKFSLASLAAALLLGSTGTSGHYTFPRLSGEQDWQSVRTTANWQNNGPVIDVSSSAIRCYERNPGTPAATTAKVQAGSTLRWSASQNVYHPGVISAYMAKVPAGSTAARFDGSGQVWFKVFQEYPTLSANVLSFPSQDKTEFSFNIPSCLPSGDYLFRIEHLALHAAGSINGAQFYLSCAQITVVGGSGSKSPSGSQLVSFPGAYKNTDPGVLVSIFAPNPSFKYQPAGPSVFTC